jgi:RNA polymerase sigma factor (sigma-70 family)
MRRDEWEAHYLRAVPEVYRALLATLRDRQRAEDALHDAFIEGMRYPPDHAGNIPGWIFRVALRRAKRRPWSFAWLHGAEEVEGPDEITLLLDRLEAGRLLALLSERQRAIVVAHYYLGLTHAETAQLIGVQPGTVSATLSQALARMRKGATHA